MLLWKDGERVKEGDRFCAVFVLVSCGFCCEGCGGGRMNV